MLPSDDLLGGSQQREALAAQIDLANQALRTWEPVWSGFVAAELREEAQRRLGALSELQLLSAGGWPQAERRRLCWRRAELASTAGLASGLDSGSNPVGDPDGNEAPAPPLMGLLISGNFLFDPAEPQDLRRGLEAAGAAAGDLGDIWMRGDRGGQAIVTPEAAARFDGQVAQVRSVAVQLQAVPLDQLQRPAERQPRQISSVEASLRLDAVGSAGFGLSRSRLADLIKAGSVRVNWQLVTSPSRELAVGDRVQLEGRGELELLEVQITKRDRWRVVMQRR